MTDEILSLIAPRLRLDFCRLCKMTAGCNFHNQLLFTACCLITVGWIKANRVSSLPILFCPLTVPSFSFIGYNRIPLITDTVYSQRTKHNRYIYHSVGFDPSHWCRTECCKQQLVVKITAGCHLTKSAKIQPK